MRGGFSLASFSTGAISVLPCDNLPHCKRSLLFYHAAHSMFAEQVGTPWERVNNEIEVHEHSGHVAFCLCRHR